LYSHPEKARRVLPSVPTTSSWTNAPVSGLFSHGALVSQARSRTTASRIRIACPGLSVRSRTMPLRLLRKPSTATRSAIGVIPASTAALLGTSVVTAFSSPLLVALGGPL